MARRGGLQPPGRVQALLAVLLAVSVLCSACGMRDGQPSSTIVFAMIWEPVSFYPLRALDSGSYYAQTLVYEGLVKFDAQMRIVPGLAESFQIADDGLAYHFKLRKNLKFSDGSPIRMEDIEQSFKLAASDLSPFKGDYSSIAKFEHGTDEITLRLKEINAPLLSRLVELRILPGRLLRMPDHGRLSLARNPVGTGPFRLVRWESGLELVFEPNPFYWSARPDYQKLVWRVIPDRNQLALAAYGGEVDVANVDSSTWAALMRFEKAQKEKGKRTSQVCVDAFNGTRTIYLGFNVQHRFFVNEKVRQALCMAVDREMLVEKYFEGLALVPAADISPGSPIFDASAKALPFDPGGAMRLLEDAGLVRDKDGGWKSKIGSERLACRILTNRDYQDIAEIVSDYWSRIGVASEVQVLDYSMLRQQFLNKGDFDTVVWSRSSGPDPECALVWETGAPLNFSRFSNSEVDRMIEVGRRTADMKQRAVAYRAIQKVLSTQVPWIFLAQPKLLIVHKRRIINTQLTGQKLTGLPWDNPLFNAASWRYVESSHDKARL